VVHSRAGLGRNLSAVFPLFRLIKITHFTHGSIALLFFRPIKLLHCSLFSWQYCPFISANQISPFFPWQYSPFLRPITHFPHLLPPDAATREVASKKVCKSNEARSNSATSYVTKQPNPTQRSFEHLSQNRHLFRVRLLYPG
jgi:hypothetical protein